MVFESTPQATGTGSRYLGEGFRHEPDFRDGTASFEVISETAAPVEPPAPPVVVGRSAKPNLDHVFDDPAHGEPGRDRMLVHGLWELFLAVAVGGVGYLLHIAQPAALTGSGLRQLALIGAVIGLIAAAAALSLRTGVPNLAVGAVAVAAATYYGQHAGSGLTQSLLMVLGLAAAVGLVQGVFVVGLHVPAWAASLGAAAGVLVWADALHAGRSATGGYDPTPHAYYWFGGFVAVSVIVGLVCLFPSVRRASGRFRAVADPARRRGTVAGIIALAALVVSTVLAALGGLLAATASTFTGSSDGFTLTALAFGAALLGGTSAFGRRGGVFGTALAVALTTVIYAYVHAKAYAWSNLALAAVAIGAGLVVTRLVERFGRPESASRDDDDDDWAPRVHAEAAPVTRTWPPTSVPATPAAGGLWASDDAWGSTDRR